jgi:aspartate aminotransferase-like enzyme
MLTPVEVPGGADDRAVRGRLLAEHRVEIMGAFGPLEGRVWRIGTMGYNARRAAVVRTLTAVSTVLGPQPGGAPLAEMIEDVNRRFDGLGSPESRASRVSPMVP